MFALEPEGNVLRWCRVGGPYRPGGLHAIGGRWEERETGRWKRLFERFDSGH